jgi:uncharacterized protein YbaR (Trm112 family)
MDTWYLENLVCPLDKTPLSLDSDILVSQTGNQYPVVDGVPVMLLKDVRQTHGAASSSLKVAWDGVDDTNEVSRLFVDTLGISNSEKRDLVELVQEDSGNIDPVVAYVIGATSGYTYKHLIGDLEEYPIPTLRLPDVNGESFLELGCNWGRWCIAAARKNYSVVGIDPSLGAIMAARRVAEQLDFDIKGLSVNNFVISSKMLLQKSAGR